MSAYLSNDPAFMAKLDAATPRLKACPEGKHWMGDYFYLVDDAGKETLMVWWSGKWNSAEKLSPLIYVTKEIV